MVMSLTTVTVKMVFTNQEKSRETSVLSPSRTLVVPLLLVPVLSAALPPVSFPSLPSFPELYRAKIAPSSGYIQTKWNDGSTPYEYGGSVSPYYTQKQIPTNEFPLTVTGGGSATANLGTYQVQSGNLIGYVFEDKNDDGVKQGGEDFTSGVTFSYSGGTPSNSGTVSSTTASPNNVTQSVNSGLYTVSVTLPGADWQVSGNSCGGTSLSCANVTVPNSGSSSPFYFALYNNPQPWYTTLNGDVYSTYCGATTDNESSCRTTATTSILDPIPTDVGNGYEAYLSSDTSASNTLGGLIISRANTGGSNCGTGSCSERGYLITDYAYIAWPEVLTNLATPGAFGNVLIVSGPLTISNSNKSTYNGKVVVVLAGDLTFDSSLGGNPPPPRTFDISGIFVANTGKIIVNDAGGNKNLALDGGLYAKGGFIFSRVLNNNKFPAIIVNYNPSLTLGSTVVSEPIYSWREVSVE